MFVVVRSFSLLFFAFFVSVAEYSISYYRVFLLPRGEVYSFEDNGQSVKNTFSTFAYCCCILLKSLTNDGKGFKSVQENPRAFQTGSKNGRAEEFNTKAFQSRAEQRRTKQTKAEITQQSRKVRSNAN